MVRPLEPPSYTPTPTISHYQPSHTGVGASSVGEYVYPAGSSVAGTSSTSHPPAAPTTPVALLPHSQRYPPYHSPFSHSPRSPIAPTSSASSSEPSIPLDALDRSDLVHPRSPIFEKRLSRLEKQARESVVIHQTHHPQGPRHPSGQSYQAPCIYGYGSGTHEIQMSPTDVNMYRA